MELVKKTKRISAIGDFSLDENLLLIAGPCAMENETQMVKTAEFLVKNGIRFLRAYPYKPRTSPDSFQGLGKDGFRIIQNLKERYHLKIVAELVDLDELDFYLENVNLIQIGARNMQNFELLKALGRIKKPLILKRGFGNTIEEWLYAAEYILKGGNDQIILCERGIRTFETMTRNTLDISAIPLVKMLTNLPIIADPSHACGRSDLVKPLSLAAVAAGADGLLLEVHPDPKNSLSDKEQALSFGEFVEMLPDLRKTAALFGKKL